MSGRSTSTGTSYCRVDFLIIEQATIFIIELDEDQHEAYPISCQSRRPIKIASTMMADGNTVPIAFIRINPDAYKVAGQPGSVVRKDRYEAVADLIREWKPTDKAVEVQYCFYNVDGDGEEFSQDLLELCRNNIY
jgi:hypothetical protein